MAKLKPREFITPERVREIKSEIKVLERQLSGGDDASSAGVGFMSHAVRQVSNPEDISREISKKKKHLEEGTPKPFETLAMKTVRTIGRRRPKSGSTNMPRKAMTFSSSTPSLVTRNTTLTEV